MKIYDLIIIGAGPAGATAALKLKKSGMSVLMIEKGRDLSRRRDLKFGWFGHGVFTMDRLELEDNILNNPRAMRDAFNIIRRIYANKIIVVKPRGKTKYCKLSPNFGPKLAAYYFSRLNEQIDIIFNTEALNMDIDGGLFVIYTTNKEFLAKRCLIATGKNSIDWIKFVCSSFCLNMAKKSIKVGVRVEVPTFKVKGIIENNGDIKTENGYVETDDIRINSFIGEWEESNLLSAFGHSLPDKKSQRTNFMVGFEPDKKISDVIKDVQIVNVLADDKIKCERVNDYMKGKTVLKHISIFHSLQKAFNELENILPSFINYATMYIPEVRLKGAFPVDMSMKTRIPGLYGAGECTSRVSTLVGAMASGLLVAHVIEKE